MVENKDILQCTWKISLLKIKFVKERNAYGKEDEPGCRMVREKIL